MPRPSKRLLIETCMEAGPLTEGQIADALEATHDTREMRAVMSLLECFIGEAHAEMTVRNQEPRIRDEASGAARYLKDLRADIIRLTARKKPADAVTKD